MDLPPDPLAQLVGDAERFAREHWARTPFLHHTGVARTDLLDLDAVESLLDSTMRRPFTRLVRADRRVAPEEYTTAVRIAGSDLADVVDADEVLRHYGDGATIVLQGLQRTAPPLVALARALEARLSHPVQVNAYLSPPHAVGLARHADVHDVFVLQIEGAKCWDADGVGEVELAPGDVLYLPTGTPHAARTGASHSLHLTIGVVRRTVRQVLRRAFDQLDSGLDEPLPLGYGHDPDALAAVLARQVPAAAEALARVDAARLAREEAARSRRRRPPPLTGRLRGLSTPGDDRAVLRAAPGLRLDDEPDGDGRAVLRLGDAALHLPPWTRPALERLLASGEVDVAHLDGLGPSGRSVLARRLVRDGMATLGGTGSTGVSAR